jgi:hypothetical protein
LARAFSAAISFPHLFLGLLLVGVGGLLEQEPGQDQLFEQLGFHQGALLLGHVTTLGRHGGPQVHERLVEFILDDRERFRAGQHVPFGGGAGEGGREEEEEGRADRPEARRVGGEGTKAAVRGGHGDGGAAGGDPLTRAA